MQIEINQPSPVLKEDEESISMLYILRSGESPGSFMYCCGFDARVMISGETGCDTRDATERL